MEFFNRAKVIRLKGHLGKYLVADDDEQTVRQSRNGSSKKARWTVEMVADNPHLIRFKSCHERYLSASNDAFLLGMTGKRVFQTLPNSVTDGSIEWEPIKEGYQVKLRTKGGKFLRANGATPPWRNSITHDLPHRTATQDWVLWDVDVIDICTIDSESLQSYPSSLSSFSSFADDDFTDYSNTRRSISSINSYPSITSDNSSHPSSTQNGMEFFERAKAVRLQSHLGKYLVADEDEQTVRQSRNGSSNRARWIVELIAGKNHVIRLKSCHGLYLTATEHSFLLGMTGKKVLQTVATNNMDASIEWEPIREGFQVKLRTKEGKYLRANGATPPWRNSITHDVPNRTATQDWVLWGVEVVDIIISDTTDINSLSSCLSPASSFNSVLDDYTASPDIGSPNAVTYQSQRSGNATMKQNSGMEFFKKAKSVRLKSHHDKFLLADPDQETVYQDRHGTSRSAKWTIEFPEEIENVIRLKSCYGKYLTATDDHVLLGVTGRKVVQSLPRKLDSSVEWEPMKDGILVKLKTRYGNYLRANSGLPPWRNSITHDIPHRHQDWILWEVDIIEILPELPEKITQSESLDDYSSSSFHLTSPAYSRTEPRDAFDASPVKAEGRLIYYYVADENGNANDAVEGPSFHFKGHGVEELTQKLEEITGLENITVCSRNKFNGNLYPLRLALPPNNANMHVVVVPASSKSQ
ncbi:PREDICTED: uncharacterized protein LOC109206714 [Nicotiana attenuata]|uniref:DUF569 domain-containing protein n=1 Tax=Nicotiana attenuata TaxID=49451 RepID=A0A1J6IL67_NICAT|nr:PREDICTED: uncharacterized protein LOC109206714 [Nicotiana attenuata]OIT05885.1 hypothetical protein A4A49_13317 [Nicotiana attenuata]